MGSFAGDVATVNFFWNNNLGQLGNRKTRFKVHSTDDVDYAIGLIRQSYEKSLIRS
jgi:predicted transport protein